MKNIALVFIVVGIILIIMGLSEKGSYSGDQYLATIQLIGGGGLALSGIFLHAFGSINEHLKRIADKLDPVVDEEKNSSVNGSIDIKMQ